MDPQNPPKHRISQIFRSCKSRDVPSDVVERPVSTRQHYQLMDLFSPKPHRPVFSLCGPKMSENEKSFPRRKVKEQFDTWREYEEERPRERRYSRKKKSKGAVVDKKGKKREKKKDNTTQWQTNIPNNNYYDWSTSDDDVNTDEDDDKTTLFSSKSLTSDSSVSSSRRSIHIKKVGDDPTVTQEGFAVVKRSSDPHSDFRTSMVEMIVEKQIFGAKELEGLLNTFLSLNSCHHHRVIIEVFTEIWEALFSDWS